MRGGGQEGAQGSGDTAAQEARKEMRVASEGF